MSKSCSPCAQVYLGSKNDHHNGNKKPPKTWGERGRVLRTFLRTSHGQVRSNGFKSLADRMSEQNIIVWLNEFLGRIERDRKRFEEMGPYIFSDSKSG
jgi:hypothetical protein